MNRSWRFSFDTFPLRRIFVMAVICVALLQGGLLFFGRLQSARVKGEGSAQQTPPPSPAVVLAVPRAISVLHKRWFGETQDAHGYLLYMNAWGQWNNHRRQLIDAVATAKALNRILVVPPFEGHDRFVNKIRKNVDFYYNRTILDELGPILTVDEYLQQQQQQQLEIEPWLFTVPVWGHVVIDAAQRVLTTLNFTSTGGSENGKVVKFDTPYWYGGFLNAEWVKTNLGNGKYDHLPLIAFTHIFSQYGFYDETALFANIRSHMIMVDKIQEYAAAFLQQMRSKYDVIVSAHLRRDDYKDFCNKNFYNDCHPDTERVITRLKQVLSEKYSEQYANKRVGVFFATNAPADEITKISSEIPNIERFSSTDEILRQFDEEHRCVMLIDVLIAAHADWFVGNNWSTLTANIMEERSVLGKDPRAFSYWGADKRPLWYGRENEKKENSCLCGETDGAVPYDWSNVPHNSSYHLAPLA